MLQLLARCLVARQQQRNAVVKAEERAFGKPAHAFFAKGYGRKAAALCGLNRRGEAVQSYRADNPIQADRFPDPERADAQSGHVFGYLGFGGWSGLKWNSTFVRWEKRHPEGPKQDSWAGETVDVHVTNFTDERTVLTVGNETLIDAIPGRLEFALGTLYGLHKDGDNSIMPSEHDRWYASAVLRAQVALTPTLAWLTESAIAQEVSTNGHFIREHEDSPVTDNRVAQHVALFLLCLLAIPFSKPPRHCLL